MKKNLMSILVATFSMTLLSGCTYGSVDPGKMEDIVGTYKLTEIKKKDEEGNDYDYKKQIGAEAYFSIGEDGYTYYAYKDNDHGWKATAMFALFEPNDEKEGYYDTITITDGTGSVKEKDREAGCGFEKLFIKNRKKSFFWRVTSDAFNKDVPYKYVAYKKVSKEIGVSGLNNASKQSFSFDKPFELATIDGLYVFNAQQAFEGRTENPDLNTFDYCILNADTYNSGKMEITYALQSDHVKKTTQATISPVAGAKSVKNVELSFSVEVEGQVRQFSLLANNEFIDVYNPVLANNFMYTYSDVEGDVEFQAYINSFNKYFGEAKTVDELIAELTAK